MEIRIKNKHKIKEKRGPESEETMRYFKIPLCRIFVWKVKDYSRPSDTCECRLR